MILKRLLASATLKESLVAEPFEGELGVNWLRPRATMIGIHQRLEICRTVSFLPAIQYHSTTIMRWELINSIFALHLFVTYTRVTTSQVRFRSYCVSGVVPPVQLGGC